MKAAILSLATAGCCSFFMLEASADPPSSRAFADSPAKSEGRADVRENRSIRERQRLAAKRAGELRQKVHERLEREATSDGPEKLRAVEDLIDLYITLRLDDSLGDLARRQLSGTVRSRLLRVQKRLAKEQARQDGAQPDAEERGTATSPLAERAGRTAAQTVAQLSHVVLAQQGVAGPAGQAAAGALAAAPPFTGDYGPDLVDLIQTVISPSTWERNGGPGSIYYYRPLRVLVIRQTGEVHGQIGGAVDALRRAGN